MTQTPNRFPLTSDQLELLIAFETSTGLAALAQTLRRDPSVVSRNLQRLAEDLPVLEKHNGRWQITPLGRTITAKTKDYLAELSRAAAAGTPGQAKPVEPYLSDRAALLVINAQLALQDPARGPRSTEDAERNIHRLLSAWRKQGKRALHVKHAGARPGSDFIPLLAPLDGEPVFEKSKASAFSAPALETELQAEGIDTLVIVGFTANECIDSTAKQAAELGYTVFVVGDATATFELSGPDGQIHKAERVHELVLANLSAFCAKVVETKTIVDALLLHANPA